MREITIEEELSGARSTCPHCSHPITARTPEMLLAHFQAHVAWMQHQGDPRHG